ncbi:hypothetical protein [Saccharopolyspora pogona]|uniref:hypothetical protein n=1 Tax=Saccharopolyspora pogona TaxID=333966 RepID=UPI0016881A15|nr:hypothetical protein [Saccharopolyspora pogona]
MKLTEEQFADVAAAATAAGMSRPAFLAWRGCQPADAARPTNLPQLRAWVAELYAIKRILRGSANNINTAVRAGHVTGELEQEALHHADRIARMEERLAELLDAVGPELKPRR